MNTSSLMVEKHPQSRPVKKPRNRPHGDLFHRLTCRAQRVSLAFSLAVSGAIPVPVAGQGDSADEYELKAAMLYNLTQFVEWPASAFPNPKAPILLCILGRDPFGVSLSSTVPKDTVNGRPVLILRTQREDEVRSCHVLYISTSERKSTAQIFSTLNGSSVLTVGEIPHFAARGGMVQFALEDQQIRFDINVDAASRAGLKISSKLLMLAQIVKEGT